MKRAMIEAAELGAAFLRGEIHAQCPVPRSVIAAAVQTIVDELDAIAGDSDFEDDGGIEASGDEDLVPWLSWGAADGPLMTTSFAGLLRGQKLINRDRRTSRRRHAAVNAARHAARDTARQSLENNAK